MGRISGGILATVLVATGLRPAAAAPVHDEPAPPPPASREFALSARQVLGAQALPVDLRQSAQVGVAEVDGNLLLTPVRLETTLVRQRGDAAVLVGDFAWQPAGASIARVGGMQWQSAARGPVEYRLGGGFLRQGYAVKPNSYDNQPVTLASLRAGWTNWLTLEAAAETGEDVRAGRIAAQAQLAEFGALSGSVARSAAPGGEGTRWTQTWQLSRGGVDLRAACTGTSGRFRSVAQLQDGSAPPRQATEVRLGGTLAGGDAHVGYAMAQPADAAATQVGTVGYARALPRRWAVSGTASHDLAASTSTTAITLSHTFR